MTERRSDTDINAALETSAPTAEQVKGLREGFAAHVSSNPDFKQAVKGLMKTQSPRGEDATRERQFVTPASDDGASAASPPAGPAELDDRRTIRDERAPEHLATEEDASRDVVEPSEAEPADALPRMPRKTARVEPAVTARHGEEAAAGKRRPWLAVAIVALFAGVVVLAVLAVLGPGEAARTPSPSGAATLGGTTTQTQTAAGQGPTTTASSTPPPSVAETATATAATTTAQPKPTGGPTAQPAVTSTAKSSATAKDPDSWRFNP